MAGAQRSSWQRDVSAGDWIAPRLHLFGQDTGSIAPIGFEAYARVFHPIEGDGRWSDVARANQRVAHSQMQLHLISAPPGEPPVFGVDAAEGRLPPAEREALVDLLKPRTTTPDACWFAVWEGFGALDRGGVVERIDLPHRRYLLATGPIESVMEPLPTVNDFDWGLSANLWWPDDRAWVVVTEIDFTWTYVGGTRAAIDAVLADDRLEALEALITDDPTYDGDTINAALDP